MSTGRSPIYGNATTQAEPRGSALGGDDSTIKAYLDGFDALNSLHVANGSFVSTIIDIDCECPEVDTLQAYVIQ